MIHRIRIRGAGILDLDHFFESREEVLSCQICANDDNSLTLYLITVDGLTPKTLTLLNVKYHIESFV